MGLVRQDQTNHLPQGTHMKNLSLDELAAKVRTAKDEGNANLPAIVVDQNGQIGEATNEAARRNLSDPTPEPFAARRGPRARGGAAGSCPTGPIRVLDTVLTDIAECIGSHAPERGGALLGSSEL